MMVGIEKLIVSLQNNIIFGVYNIINRNTLIALIEGNNNIWLEFTNQILSLLEVNSIIIYNRINHFKYLLKLPNQAPIVPININKSTNLLEKEIIAEIYEPEITPSNEDYIITLDLIM